MATESLPESACLSLENFVVELGAVLAKSSEDSLFPASNLLLRDRTERWWTTDSTTAGTVTFDLGSAKLPTFLALIDSNLDSGESVVLKGADDSEITAGVLTWTFTTWTQSDIGKMLRWYMADPDSGSAVAKRYWQLTLPANGTSEANHKLGGLWLGEREPFLISPGTTSSPVNPARREGQFLVHRELDVGVAPNLGWVEFKTLREKLEKLQVSQQKHCILDEHGNATTDDLRALSAHYGILLDVDGRWNHAENSELGFTFGETHEEYLGG